MNVIQSPQFERKIKKFNKNQKSDLDEQIRKIMKNPGIGEEKKGDLKGVFVYKFRLLNIQYLLSYRFHQGNIELITIGPHENYYRDLKTYLKSR